MIDFLKDNWLSLIAVVTAAVALFKAVAAITPTKADDKIANAISDWIEDFVDVDDDEDEDEALDEDEDEEDY